MEQTPKRNRKGPQPAAGEPSSCEANADKKTPKWSAGKASSKKTAARPVSHMAGRSRNKSAPDAGSGIEIDPASYLDGQLLVAMPVMDDERFARSVIYVCAHSSEGAMGIIVNRPAGSIDFPELLAQLDIIDKSSAIKLPESAESMKVLKGGPVDTGRGFVLHSSDFFIEDATLPIDDGICLTATVDILRAIANGGGPKHAILALGYAGWAPGQLETEIQGNGWLHCDADEDLIFGRDIEEKYRRALQKIGIAPGMLSAEAGHA